MEDSTNASYLLKLLATGWKSCNHRNNPPNFVLLEQAVFDIAERIANSSGQFTTPTKARTKRMADLGFSVLEYRGIPLMVDNFINSTNYPMYMGNTNFMKLYFHPDDNFKVNEFVRPANQDARLSRITALLQLGISSRRHFYRWTDLNN